MLLGGLAVAGALQQVGYNWFSFYRARGESWPQAVESVVFGVAFAVLAVPGALLGGVVVVRRGPASGCTVCVLAVRRVYVRRLLPGVRLIADRAARRRAGRAGDAAGAGGAARAVGRGADARSRRCGELALWLRRGSASAPTLGASRAEPAGTRLRRVPAPVSGEPRCSGSRPPRISGFTLRRYLGPVDEGILMQAASRMASGQWPWRDFGWAYGPGQPLVVMLGRQAVRPVAAVVAAAARRRRRDDRACSCGRSCARRTPALGALRPGPPRRSRPRSRSSANPTAPALAFALGAVLLATRGRPAWAGVAAAAAAFWRPDMGAIAALAAAVTLVVAARRRGGGVAAGGGEAAGGEAAGAAARRRRGPRARRVAWRGHLPRGRGPRRPRSSTRRSLIAAGPGRAVGRARRPGHARRRVVAAAVPGRVPRSLRALGAEGLPALAGCRTPRCSR